jgi:hypothetical protein
MKKKWIAVLFLLIGLGLGLYFFLNLNFPIVVRSYFQKAYYDQFAPLVMCVELSIAGGYLLIGHTKANFTLALFGFTVIMDLFFNLVGLFDSSIPVFGRLIFTFCALWALWLAFSNTFELDRMTVLKTAGSFALGTVVELFFNNW